MRSGDVDIYRGGLWGSGYEGDYWLSFAYEDDDDSAYSFYFGNESAPPEDYYKRYYGFSLRCLSTVLDR